MLICRNLSSAQTIAREAVDAINSLVCSDKPVSPARNILPGKGIENLTDLNLQITEAIGSVQPKRVALDILSDILLRHKALQTRKWLNELLERLRPKSITTLAVLNPYMHSSEDVQAVVDLFDGNLEIFEKDVEGTLRKFLHVKWMHGIEVAEKDLPLIDLAGEQMPVQQVRVSATPPKEPRWLTPLVSRTAELTRLKTAFENARANRSSVVSLQGEAGAGKTRLMQELAAYAQSKGAVVLSGSASEGGLPYGLWIDVARQYVSQAPGELLRRILGNYSSEFAKLVPDIAATLGTIPPSKPLGEQQDKIRFYEAVIQFFVAICQDAPLLILFDDVQHADQASLDLLEYYVRSTANLPVLTVCSCPSEEFDQKNPLYLTFMKFNKQRLLETISVKNLNKEETTDLIKRIFDEKTVTPEFADLIFNRTGGNPFFVEEVLRSLVEDGTIFRTEERWDRKPIQEIVVPESVKATLRSRLAKLEPETLSLLTMAAVIGSELDFQVLREVTQVEQDKLLEKIETVLSAELLLEDQRRQGILKFADNRFRELLLDDLSKLRKSNYHLRIAEAMEKIYAESLQTHAEAIANHFFETGDKKRAVKYSIMAGDRNTAIHAYEQAINSYKRASDLIDLEGKDEEKGVALEKLAESYRLAGRLQEADRCFRDALKIFEKLHDMKACARISLGLSRAQMPLQYRDTILILRKGLEYLETEPECFEAASIYARLSSGHAVIDEWDQANAWAEKALSVGKKTQNSEAIVTALSTKAYFLTDTGRVDEGLPLLEEAYELAMKHEQYDEAINALANLSCYTYPRNLAKARERAVEQLELCKRLNHITAEGVAWYWLWTIDWCAGDWKTGLEEHKKGAQIAERLGLFEAWAVAGDYGWFLLGMGDLEQAEAEFLKTTDVMKENPKISFRVIYHLELGMLREAQGREVEAREHYETGVDAIVPHKNIRKTTKTRRGSENV